VILQKWKAGSLDERRSDDLASEHVSLCCEVVDQERRKGGTDHNQNGRELLSHGFNPLPSDPSTCADREPLRPHQGEKSQKRSLG